MKFEVQRNGIIITPENDQDIAFVEDTLGLHSDGESVLLKREGNSLVTVTVKKSSICKKPGNKITGIEESNGNNSRQVGMIKSYNPDKGYGFIVNENENDIFFHISNFEEKGIVPTKGMEVSFSIIGSDFFENGLKASDIRFGSTMPK